MRNAPAPLLAALLLAGACSDPLLPPGDLPDAGPRPDLSGPDPSAPLFAPDHIVEVDIRISPADWDTLRMQTRTITDILTNCFKGPFPDPFTYFPGTVTVDGQTLQNVGVRKKGFLGSLDSDRPSIKLKFDEYVNGQKLAGLKNFTLNNSRQDPSFIHQCLAYQTFTAAGVPASRCNFAHVKVNGSDLGLYVHVESGSKEFLARHYIDPEGNLYEGTLSDFRDGWTTTFELKTNEAKNDRTDLAPVVTALEEASDDDLLAKLDPVVDVDRFLTFWAVESLVAHWDGYTGDANNFFAYHNPTTGRFEFLPWGPDATFTHRAPVIPNGPQSVLAVSLLARRLYLNGPTRDRYIVRLREVLAHAWNEAALGAEIDRMEKLIRSIADPQGNRGVAGQIEAVRDFVSRRRGEIESEISNGPPGWSAALREAPCLQIIGDVAGSMQTTWGTVGMPNPLGIGSGTLSGTINGAALDVMKAGAVAGVDPKAMQPAQAQVAVVGAMRDGSATVVAFAMPPARVQPNATVQIDLQNVGAGVYRVNMQTGKVDPIGGLLEGALHFGQAGTTQGATVTATFTGKVVKQ
mgnify:FL=1